MSLLLANLAAITPRHRFCFWCLISCQNPFSEVTQPITWRFVLRWYLRSIEIAPRPINQIQGKAESGQEHKQSDAVPKANPFPTPQPRPREGSANAEKQQTNGTAKP